jgi:hypothetical protein
MKKTYFIMIYIVMVSAFTAFGQSVVSGSTDADNNGNPEPLPAVSASETVPADPAAHTDTGAAEVEVPSTPEANAENEPSVAPKTVVIPEQSNKTQERKDVVEPVEKNEPTRRTKRKQRAFSMHTGFVVSATAANNMVSVPDFLKPQLVIDLNKLAKNTMKSGIHAGAIFDFDYFFRFTVLEDHTVKLSVTANGDAWGNLPKTLLDIAANGNAANANGETIKDTINAKTNIFADIGVMYQLTKPRYGFSARLAYFAPIAYMENPKWHYSLSPHTTGGVVDGITMKAGGTANIYGALSDYFANGKLSITDILKNGGVDLSLMGMYSPANWVAITGGVNYLPLMPVVTKKGLRASFNYEGSVNNFLGSIASEDPSFLKQTMKTESSGSLPEKKIMRPLKIQIGADFRPFRNNYMILSPFLAFPVLNANPYYVDGGLKLESRFAKVLGVYLDTRCIERMWRYELCFLIDSRWFSFQLAASVASQDFKRTFTTLSGLGVKLGLGIGF